MGQFGGWGKFGGGFKFGGSKPKSQIYYQVLKDLGPPGLRPNDDDLLTNHLLRCDATGLGMAHDHIDHLFAEIFPHTAAETLAQWETLLGVVSPLGATLTERREAILARWRGAAGNSLPELRAMFYPLLNPTSAWRDEFADEYLSTRWNVAGAGTYTEGTPASMLRIEAVVATDCALDGTSDNGEIISQRLHDISDDWNVDALQDAAALANDTAVGLIAFRDYQNFYEFGIVDVSGTVKLMAVKVVEGVQTVDVDSAGISLPAATLYLRLAKVAGNMVFSYGTVADTWIELASFAAEFVPREVGLYARNDAVSQLAATMDFDWIKLTHATPENNVTIIEVTAADTAISGDGDSIFNFFIHRDPEDAGTYDIKNAQRQLDRVKQAHTLGTVGESDVFLCDDLESLTDRDILGS